jgi:hypothetical protein
MITASTNVQRTGTILRPGQSRVLLRPFRPETPERASRIIARIMSLPESQVGPLLGWSRQGHVYGRSKRLRTGRAVPQQCQSGQVSVASRQEALRGFLSKKDCRTTFEQDLRECRVSSTQ